MQTSSLKIATLALVLDLICAPGAAGQGGAPLTFGRLASPGLQVAAASEPETRAAESVREAARLVPVLADAAPVLPGCVTDPATGAATITWGRGEGPILESPLTPTVLDAWPDGPAGSPTPWPALDGPAPGVDLPPAGSRTGLLVPFPDLVLDPVPEAGVLAPPSTTDLRPLLHLGLVRREAVERARSLDGTATLPRTRPPYPW